MIISALLCHRIELVAMSGYQHELVAVVAVVATRLVYFKELMHGVLY